LEEAGTEGMSTRTLLREVDSTSYAQRMLKLGVDKGYIRRELRPAPEGQKGEKKKKEQQKKWH
jgi:hypothetical protein